jgi:hypothetical protein
MIFYYVIVAFFGFLSDALLKLNYFDKLFDRGDFWIAFVVLPVVLSCFHPRRAWLTAVVYMGSYFLSQCIFGHLLEANIFIGGLAFLLILVLYVLASVYLGAMLGRLVLKLLNRDYE